MMSALMVQGVQPGPLLITQYPEIFWAVIASMYIGNVMLVILNVPLISVWVSLLRIPPAIFLPLILAVSIIGTFSARNSMLDLYVLFFLGLVGYLLRKLDFHLAPMVVGVVLAPLIEKHLREGLFMSRGDISVFYSSPIALTIWLMVLAVLLLGLSRKVYNKYLGGEFTLCPKAHRPHRSCN